MTETREAPAVKAPGKDTIKKISPGDRIGDLTVLCDTGERKYRCVVWRCRCELCGNEAEFISRDLFQKGIRDCGCRTNIRRSYEKIKPGDQFGYLTVLSDSGKRKGTEIIWDCQCQCGNEIPVNTVSLHSGKTTDCGCVSSRKTDLMGRKFGKLTVIGDEGIQKGDHIWRCLCECGNECLVTYSHLVHGRVKSCGCLHDSAWEENLKLVDGTSVTKLEARRADSDKLYAGNTSGFNGVYPQNSHGKKTGRWVAQIGFKGRRYYLGAFARPEEAAEARKLAEERLYDGFLDWYYNEYLPERKRMEAEAKAAETGVDGAAAAEPAPRKKRIQGEHRPSETAAVLR